MIGDLLIVDRDRDLFTTIEIEIADRHLVKRSQDDRDREIQRSRSEKRDLLSDLLSINIFINFQESSNKFYKIHDLTNDNVFSIVPKHVRIVNYWHFDMKREKYPYC